MKNSNSVPRTLWGSAGELNKESCIVNTNVVIELRGVKMNDPDKICESFNECFINVGGKTINTK